MTVHSPTTLRCIECAREVAEGQPHVCSVAMDRFRQALARSVRWERVRAAAERMRGGRVVH